MDDDDFSRRVYCVLGVPVDDITMPSLVARIHGAASARKPLFISTPNLNYLMTSQRDPAFRRSLLESDLCPADGVGVLLLCRLWEFPSPRGLRAPISPRHCEPSKLLQARDFGSCSSVEEPGVGERAREALNRGRHGASRVCRRH